MISSPGRLAKFAPPSDTYRRHAIGAEGCGETPVRCFPETLLVHHAAGSDFAFGDFLQGNFIDAKVIAVKQMGPGPIL